MEDLEGATTEDILKAALQIYWEAKADNFENLSTLPIVEGGCAWLNEGMCSHLKSAEEQRIVYAILAQGLAAMILDGYSLIKLSDVKELRKEDK